MRNYRPIIIWIHLNETIVWSVGDQQRVWANLLWLLGLVLICTCPSMLLIRFGEYLVELGWRTILLGFQFHQFKLGLYFLFYFFTDDFVTEVVEYFGFLLHALRIKLLAQSIDLLVFLKSLAKEDVKEVIHLRWAHARWLASQNVVIEEPILLDILILVVQLGLLHQLLFVVSQLSFVVISLILLRVLQKWSP